jgi:TatD DNase family protein
MLVRMGWMLSFNGVITFKNARKALEVIRQTPMEHLMIETDSPYLAPVPFRGQRNDSRNVHLVAEKMAELKGISVEEVERITTENGKRFFHIP